MKSNTECLLTWQYLLRSKYTEVATHTLPRKTRWNREGARQLARISTRKYGAALAILASEIRIRALSKQRLYLRQALDWIG